MKKTSQVVGESREKLYNLVKLRSIFLPFALFFGSNSYLVACEHRDISSWQEKNDSWK